MKAKTILGCIITFCIFCFDFDGSFAQEPDHSQRANPPYIMVHFMPWFQTPEVHGYWGGHWTMDNCNPDSILENGQRQIAAHYYPLTGPYDSSDPHLLEYQALLMRLGGIDGIIVDWGGYEDRFDWKINHDSTVDIFNYMKKGGLKFSVCYEDITIKMMVENDFLSESEKYSYGQEVMLYMQNNWFNDDTYLKIGEKPVLLNFGPQYFQTSPEWETLFSVLDSIPLFFPLSGDLQPAAAGSFPWPPMHASVDGVLSDESLAEYLNNFYNTFGSYSHLVGGAWPGFHDYYFEGGYGFTYGYLDSQDGRIFDSTLQTAIDNNPDVIQIVTWNDWGEGTIIEPSEEFGYLYLEKLQEFRRAYIDSSFPYRPEDLEIPLQIFNLRKENKNATEINDLLDEAFDFIVADKLDSAVSIVQGILNPTGVEEISGPTPVRFSLGQNYPNPFNPKTTIAYTLPKASDISITVYNITGQVVDVLVNEHRNSGAYTLQWDAGRFSSGIYFYRIQAGEFVETKKMLLLR